MSIAESSAYVSVDDAWIAEKKAGAIDVKAGSFSTASERYLKAVMLLNQSFEATQGKRNIRKIDHQQAGVELAKLYCNLSFCYSQLENPEFALEAANEAIRMVGSLGAMGARILAKAYARRGMALQLLQFHEEAVHAFASAVESAGSPDERAEFTTLLKLSEKDLVPEVTQPVNRDLPCVSEMASQGAANLFADSCYSWCLPYMSAQSLLCLGACAKCFNDTQMATAQRVLSVCPLKEVLSVAPSGSVAPPCKVDDKTSRKISQTLHAIDGYISRSVTSCDLITSLWETLLATPRYTEADRRCLAKGMVNIWVLSLEERHEYSSSLVGQICRAAKGTRDERRMVQYLMVAILDSGASQLSPALIHYRHLLQAAMSCSHPGDIGKCAAEGVCEILGQVNPFSGDIAPHGDDDDDEELTRPHLRQHFVTHLFSSGLVHTLMKFVTYAQQRLEIDDEGEEDWLCELLEAAYVFFCGPSSLDSDEEESKKVETTAREKETFTELAGNYSIHLLACKLHLHKDGEQLAKEALDRIRAGFSGLRSSLIDAEGAGRLDGSFLMYLLKLNVARFHELGQNFFASRDLRTEVFYLAYEIRRRGGPYAFFQSLQHGSGILDYIKGLRAMKQLLCNCLLHLKRV